MTGERQRGVSDALLAAALVPIGALVAIGGFATSAVAVGQWNERRAYVSASPCDGGTEGCYRDLDGVVERRWEERRRGRGNRRTEYHVDLHVSDPEFLAAETAEGIVVATANDAYSAMSPGRSVTVRMWNGRPARLTVPGAGSVETNASPRTRAITLATLGPLLLTGGVAASYNGYATVRGDGSLGARRRRSYAFWSVAFGWFVAFALARAFGDMDAWMLAGAGLAAGVVAFAWARKAV